LSRAPTSARPFVERVMPVLHPWCSRVAMLGALVLLTFGVVAASAASGPADRTTIEPNAQRVKPKAYNVGGALALRDDVGYEFVTTGGPVRLQLGRVTNESGTTTSGTVRIGLFLTNDPSPGTYYVVASTDLGPLAPNSFFGPLTHTVPYSPPPDGTYYVHLGAFEFEPGTCTAPENYCLDDFVSFVNRVQVVNGQIFDAGPTPPPTTTAIEFYHTNFNHYFLTTFADEIALLDAGNFPGWVRTGRSFRVWTTNEADKSGVCRFFSASFAPRSSHFYTPFQDECTTVRTNVNWQFEAVAFYVQFPTFSGACAAGTTPLFRLYNNGMSGAPNHRYTVDSGVRQLMIGQGWTPEGYGPLGAIACVPL
jgi:hypothetical protein